MTRTRVRQTVALASALVIAGLLVGCGTKVENVDPTTEGYITGRWNDSDARAVAEELIPQCLGEAWIYEYRGRQGEQRPRIVIGEIENNTNEHINKDVFMNQMQRVLINSGVVRFVADPEVRAALMDEVQFQKDMAKGGGVAPDVEQGVSGADFMLMGTISSIVDQEGGNAIVFYQVDLTLTDLRSWEKVWMGQAQRKHLVERAKTRF
jgi:PBP1b-binding outer membrane lipoprotein LpoB